MKITGQRPPGATELNAGKAREAEGKSGRSRAQAKRGQEGSAPTESHKALTTQRLREAIRATPDVRTDRVEAVREQIRSGKYRVDAERLADALLNESLREDVEKP
jgi:negative regulator of flagellin synthesis FlgM